MARHRKRTTEDQSDPAMDISSMIDCCFLLLIYFLVATTLVSEKKLDISIPGSSSGTSSEKAPLEPGRIDIKSDGSVFWNTDMSVAPAFDPDAQPGTPEYSEQRHIDELVDALKLLKDQAVAASTTPIVIMTGDAAAPHQRVVDVMAALATAGIRTVGLNTTTEG
ncbi:MAG: biopolymer transporter ExbD [Akkermansia sp.]